MQFTPRKNALIAGVNRYEGLPCRHGHGTLRVTRNQQCVVCWRIERKAHKKRNGRKRKPRPGGAEKLRAWKKANPAARTAQRRMRKMAQAQRVPLWARNTAHRKAIVRVYQQAQLASELTGTPHEVDHVYPLKGRRVSGLHVVENLRVIPAGVNLAKSNRDPLEFILS